MSTYRVLVVDDDPTSIAVLRGVLESLGCEVEVRDRAIGTASVVMERYPDLVIVDVEMPALRGDALIAILRKRWPGVRCVLFSSLSNEELEHLRVTCHAEGAVHKLQRPSELRAVFAALLRSPRK